MKRSDWGRKMNHLSSIDVSVLKIGIDANAGSIDLVGVRSGVFTPSENTPQINQGIDLNVGIVSFTTTDTESTTVTEKSISVGVSVFEFYKKEITETYQATNQSTTTTDSGVKAADIKVKAAFIFGIELGLNIEKAANALYNLLKTE